MLAILSLIVLLFSNAFVKTAVLVDFKFHQTEIAKTLCIQKEVKNNTCSGKCHLAKQLEKTDESSEESPVLPETLNEILLYSESEVDFKVFDFEVENVQNPRVSNLFGSNVLRSIFHPPSFVLS
jgi:hypothetical protein